VSSKGSRYLPYLLNPDPDQGFSINPDPDPGFDDQKWAKFTVRKIVSFFETI
jgi:hypothetical protein